MGTVSCFENEKMKGDHKGAPLQEKNNFKLSKLFSLLEQRKKKLPEKSYSTLMFTKGNKFIGEKITEEASEIIEEIENKQNADVNKQRVIEESCDLLFHLFALNVENNISLSDLENELAKRNDPNYLHKSKQ